MCGPSPYWGKGFVTPILQDGGNRAPLLISVDLCDFGKSHGRGNSACRWREISLGNKTPFQLAVMNYSWTLFPWRMGFIKQYIFRQRHWPQCHSVVLVWERKQYTFVFDHYIMYSIWIQCRMDKMSNIYIHNVPCLSGHRCKHTERQLSCKRHKDQQLPWSGNYQLSINF